MSSFTPHMDNFAKKSIKLTNYYTEFLCTPARASLLTGKNPIHTGMQSNVIYVGSPYGLPLEHKLMPEYLKSQGYVTHMVGKWHLGSFNSQYLPNSRGFDSFLGYYAHGWKMASGFFQFPIPPKLWGFDSFLGYLNGEEDYYGKYQAYSGHTIFDFFFNEMPIKDDSILGLYSLDSYDMRVRQIIQEHDASEPLFLYYSTQAIHHPFSEPPTSMLTDYQYELGSKMRKDVKDARGLLAETSAAMDFTFLNLMSYLQEKGMYENSVIVVASDNGGCSYKGGDNYPLRGQKQTLFEGGVRVNAFVHSPLLPEATQGTEFDCMFHVVDWLPTLVEGVAGAQTAPDIDGVNHWEALMKNFGVSAGQTCYRSEMLHNINVMIDDSSGLPSQDTLQASLRLNNLKLVYGQYEEGWWTSTEFSDENCDLASYDFGFPPFGYVFDIEEDPEERHNLIDKVDEASLATLWSTLDRYFDSMTAPAAREIDPTALYAFLENDNFVLPWVSNEDLIDPQDPFMKEMQEENEIDEIDEHSHPDMVPHSSR
eukprot:CAMPEP_0194743010 /NCGR_PEP_ID=MMETSP0296-20130528/100076_1 /TAXON_ID=39354 /ORGANISM="Heterosigma akashiwo, Strain CCMP2393" /LENGTH=536 /DNA_ID=CAMNT_0039654995 /DNA_START=262 /DNA_END=1873 /DNA_ORIENTATION=+